MVFIKENYFNAASIPKSKPHTILPENYQKPLNPKMLVTGFSRSKLLVFIYLMALEFRAYSIKFF